MYGKYCRGISNGNSDPVKFTINIPDRIWPVMIASKTETMYTAIRVLFSIVIHLSFLFSLYSLFPNFDPNLTEIVEVCLNII